VFKKYQKAVKITAFLLYTFFRICSSYGESSILFL
jgi:hypothetical protein